MTWACYCRYRSHRIAPVPKPPAHAIGNHTYLYLGLHSGLASPVAGTCCSLAHKIRSDQISSSERTTSAAISACSIQRSTSDIPPHHSPDRYTHALKPYYNPPHLRLGLGVLLLALPLALILPLLPLLHIHIRARPGIRPRRRSRRRSTSRSTSAHLHLPSRDPPSLASLGQQQFVRSFRSGGYGGRGVGA